MVPASTEKHEKHLPASRMPGAARAPHSPAKLLAHDTRNWLTVLQVYCDLLQTSGAEARYPEWIQELSAAVVRGQTLIGSLLDSVQVSDMGSGFSSAGSPMQGPCGKKTVEGRPPLDLARALERRLPMLQRLAGPHTHVHVETDPGCANIAIAEGDFDRILHNLVVNALEAMPQGGDLHISLSTTHVESRESKGQPSSSLLLRVSDTGAGISPKLLPHIFQAGISDKKPRADQPEGERGLGLAIVRDLTIRAGGMVRVRSHRGRGTCFEIELPFPRASRTQTYQQSVPRSIHVTTPAGSNLQRSKSGTITFPPHAQDRMRRHTGLKQEAETDARVKNDRLRGKA